MPEQIQELTLLLMYLTSWQERRTIGLRRKPHKTDDMLLRRCWKGYDFSVLERLEAQGGLHRIALDWKPAGGDVANGYDIQRSMSPDGGFETIGSWSGNATSEYADTAIVP